MKNKRSPYLEGSDNITIHVENRKEPTNFLATNKELQPNYRTQG